MLTTTTKDEFAHKWRHVKPHNKKKEDITYRRRKNQPKKIQIEPNVYQNIKMRTPISYEFTTWHRTRHKNNKHINTDFFCHSLPKLIPDLTFFACVRSELFYEWKKERLKFLFFVGQKRKQFYGICKTNKLIAVPFFSSVLS